MLFGPVIRSSLHGDIASRLHSNQRFFVGGGFNRQCKQGGSLAKMTMEELNSAVEHDDEYVVHVSDQKTFATNGPARIVLSSKLYSLINIFARKARSKVVGFAANPKGTVFLVVVALIAPTKFRDALQ